MASAEAEPMLFLPNTRGWIVGPTYDLGEKEFRYMWDDIVVRLELGPHLARKAYNVRTGEMYIEMPWGSRVEVKSADHPDGLVGEGLDWIIVSEAAKQKKVVWEKYLRPALADKRGWAIFPSTPEGFNWFFDIYQLGQDPNRVDWESWNFPSWENPIVYPGGFEDEEIQSQMRSPDDPWFWQEIGASFRSFVGQIYSEWDDNVHIMDHYEYRPEWDNYLAIDFGYTDPTRVLDVQITPSGTLYVWREYHAQQKPLHIVGQELRDRENPLGYRITAGFGDAADPGALATFSEILQAPVTGDPMTKKPENKIQGIREIKRLLKDRWGKSHLFISRSCKEVIFEFPNYRIKPQRIEDENSKEEPKKFKDHSLDALRYLVLHLFVLGAKHHLEEVWVPPGQNSSGPVELPERPSRPDSPFTMARESVFTLGGERF
jgi:hypothetical protein